MPKKIEDLEEKIIDLLSPKIMEDIKSRKSLFATNIAKELNTTPQTINNYVKGMPEVEIEKVFSLGNKLSLKKEIWDKKLNEIKPKLEEKEKEETLKKFLKELKLYEGKSKEQQEIMLEKIKFNIPKYDFQFCFKLLEYFYNSGNKWKVKEKISHIIDLLLGKIEKECKAVGLEKELDRMAKLRDGLLKDEFSEGQKNLLKEIYLNGISFIDKISSHYFQSECINILSKTDLDFTFNIIFNDVIFPDKETLFDYNYPSENPKEETIEIIVGYGDAPPVFEDGTALFESYKIFIQEKLLEGLKKNKKSKKRVEIILKRFKYKV